MYVYGHRANQKNLEALSKKLELPMAPTFAGRTKALDSIPPETLNNQVLLMNLTTPSQIEQLLSYTPRLIIQDTPENSDFDISPSLLCQDGFFLSVSTEVAYKHSLALYVYRMMQRRNFFCDNPDALIIALQEGIANAVLHGNIGINQNDRNTLHTLKSLNHNLERALKTPEISQKHLTVTLRTHSDSYVFSIRDQGTWSTPTLPQKPSFLHGTAIIEKLTSFYFVDEKVSCVTFGFKKQKKACQVCLYKLLT